MVERNVANIAQNRYAQSEGINIMSNADGSSELAGGNPKPKSSEVKKRHDSSVDRDKVKRTYSRRDQLSPETVRALNSTRARMAELEPQPERPKIPYERVSDAIQVLSDIREGRDVVLDEADINRFKGLVVDFSPKTEKDKAPDQVSSLKPEELILKANDIVAIGNVVMPDVDSDFWSHTKDAPARPIQEELVHNRIKKAKEFSQDPLDLAKIREHLTISDVIHGDFTKEHTVGAAAPAPPASPDNIQKLIKRKWEVYTASGNNLAVASTNADWIAADTQIQNIINSTDIKVLFDAKKEVQDSLTAYSGTLREADFGAVFDTAKQGALETNFNNAYNVMDTEFQNMSVGEKKRAFGDLDLLAQSQLSYLTTYGQGDFDEIRKNLLIQAVHPDKLAKIVPGQEELRVWYALKRVETAKNAYDIEQRRRVQADPLKNVANAYETMEFAESLKGRPEDIEAALGSLRVLLEAVKNSQDASVTEEIKSRLQNHIEAFQRYNTLYLQYEQSGGEPEVLIRASGQLKDETFKDVYDRFKDLYDHVGNRIELRDTTGVERHILVEAERTVIEQYEIDRFRVSQMEELQKHRLPLGHIGHPILDEDIDWIKEKIQRELDRKHLSDPAAGWDSISVSNVWENASSDDKVGLESINVVKEDALSAWYQQKTLLGANGTFGNEDDDDMEGRLSHPDLVGKKREEIYLEDTAPDQLRQRLLHAGIGVNEVDKIMNDEKRLNAIIYNASTLARFKLQDSYDRFRVYSFGDKHIGFGQVRNNIVNAIRNDRTPYSAWVASQYMEDAAVFGHGDPHIMEEMRDLLDDKQAGFLLPQNIPAGRIYSWLAADGKIDPSLKSQIDREIQDEAERQGTTQKKDVDSAVIMRDLFKGYDPTGLITSSKIRFSEIDWADASHSFNKGRVQDLFDDRNKGMAWEKTQFRQFTYMPLEGELMEMVGKYYSMRNARRHGATEMFTRVYKDMSGHLKEWFNYKDNLSNSDVEVTIQRMEEKNFIGKKQGEDLKNDLLGKNGLDRIRKQIGESLGQSVIESKFLLSKMTWSVFWDMFADFFKKLPGQLQGR